MAARARRAVPPCGPARQGARAPRVRHAVHVGADHNEYPDRRPPRVRGRVLAAHPFVVTWDDHETENNYAEDIPENSVPPEEFLLRRAAAYRAYWENQPLRRPQRPEGPDMKLYRRLHFGRHAQFDILDTRKYRSN